MNWEPYDPAWLITVVEEHGDRDQQWLKVALLACTTAARTSDPEARAEYHHFVDRTRANEPGSEWQFLDTVSFETVEADVNIDVLRGNRIGGVELLPYRWPARRRG